MSFGLTASITIPLLLVTVLFLRTGPEQPLRHRQLWITPAIAVGSIGAALAMQAHPPFGPIALSAVLLALAVGIVTGTLLAGTVRMRIAIWRRVRRLRETRT